MTAATAITPAIPNLIRTAQAAPARLDVHLEGADRFHNGAAFAGPLGEAVHEDLGVPPRAGASAEAKDAGCVSVSWFHSAHVTCSIRDDLRGSAEPSQEFGD